MATLPQYVLSSSAYTESWQSVVTRHMEAVCSTLNITVNEWTLSIFIGIALGFLIAVCLYAKDYVKARRRWQAKLGGDCRDSLLDEVGTLADSHRAGASMPSSPSSSGIDEDSFNPFT